MGSQTWYLNRAHQLAQLFISGLAFDFGLGHTASAKLICQDADGQSDEQTLTIAVP